MNVYIHTDKSVLAAAMVVFCDPEDPVNQGIADPTTAALADLVPDDIGPDCSPVDDDCSHCPSFVMEASSSEYLLTALAFMDTCHKTIFLHPGQRYAAGDV